MLKILIADDLSTDNEYVRILFESLHSKSGLKIDFGINNIFTDRKYDIIHFQWPESIYNWEKISRNKIENFKHTLQTKKTKILTTYHNAFPHHYKNSYQPLYDLIYSKSDGFIHHCEDSIHSLKNNYAEIIKPNSIHSIINHHLYAKKNVLNPDLKMNLGLKNSDKVVLVMGNIRNFEESKFIIQAFNQLDIKDKKLVVPRFCFNSIDVKYLRRISRWMNSLKYYDHKTMILNSEKISAEQISSYMNIADVLFIPRNEVLNSGLVFLGLTYGTNMVGTNFGCIGHILKKQIIMFLIRTIQMMQQKS